MLNEEGGIDPLEYRFYAMTDRVATTATVWLGLTMGCVQCHTHKYDPIPHREYYRFMAMMNNTEEPELEVPTPKIRRAVAPDRRADRREIADFPIDSPLIRLQAAMHGPKRSGESRILERKFRDWLTRQESESVRWTTLTPVKASANLPHLTIQEDGSFSSAATRASAICTRSSSATSRRGSPRSGSRSCPTNDCPSTGRAGSITRDRPAISS